MAGVKLFELLTLVAGDSGLAIYSTTMLGLTKYPRRALHLSGLDAKVRWGSFSGPPHFGPLETFFGFFLLNLGSTAPNYSRRPLMRSSKAPPNQMNRGQVLPHPSEPSLRA